MDALPPNAGLYLPVLVSEYKRYWSDMPYPHLLAGQVEQETCISLKSKGCWNPKTENINPKNNGEYGFGLGQLTKTNKFNAFEEAKARFDGVRDWKWENRFDPAYQLRTMIYMDKAAYKNLRGVTVEDKLAFTFSAYNGGVGGVLQSKKLCQQVPGCDPYRWTGHVAEQSLSKRTLPGYRLTAFQINREYVHNIMHVRSEKYKEHTQ